jgi:hypothetical protein
MAKFTVSDALAAVTTGIGVAGSFSDGMKYNPHGDKPKLFQPIRRPDVGSPTLHAQLADLDSDTASTARMFGRSGSDAGLRGLSQLELNRQKMEGKQAIYGEHDKLLTTQRIEGDRAINAANEGNVNRTNKHLTDLVERDKEGALNAQDYAYEAIQSGVDYAGAKDANTRDDAVKTKQANNRITILKASMKQNFLASMTPTMGSYDKALEAWNAQEEEAYKPFNAMYSKGYEPEETSVADGTVGADGFPVKTEGQSPSASVDIEKAKASGDAGVAKSVTGNPIKSYIPNPNRSVKSTNGVAKTLNPKKTLAELRKYWQNMFDQSGPPSQF